MPQPLSEAAVVVRGAYLGDVEGGRCGCWHDGCRSRGMTHARLALGQRGEDIACRELERRGYEILERRYRTASGELDIVARDGEYLVFVEVKARQDGRFGDPEEAVTLHKQHKLVWMATDYLARRGFHEVPCRFDVVAINTSVDPPDVVVLQDAFRPGW
jgi:putative endonuclease